MEGKNRNLEEKIGEIIKNLNNFLEGDFARLLGLAIYIETLPNEVNKDPLYAGLVIELTNLIEGCEEGYTETKKLIKEMRDFYKEKCSYFKK